EVRNLFLRVRHLVNLAPKSEVGFVSCMRKLRVIYIQRDNLLQQSISLMRVNDPLFKRMGASRINRFAFDGSGVSPCSLYGLTLLLSPIKREVVLDIARLVNLSVLLYPIKRLGLTPPLRFWIILSCLSLVFITGHSKNEPRMRVVEMGGDKDLVEMLKFVNDDKTHKSALKVLSALSILVSLEDAELNTYKIKLLHRFQDLKYDDAQPDLS
ncbi:hypothetical protein MKW98_010289, partial [Papaver atlanticum]